MYTLEVPLLSWLLGAGAIACALWVIGLVMQKYSPKNIASITARMPRLSARSPSQSKVKISRAKEKEFDAMLVVLCERLNGASTNTRDEVKEVIATFTKEYELRWNISTTPEDGKLKVAGNTADKNPKKFIILKEKERWMRL